MKKMILTAALTVCAMAADAQLYVQGTLGGGVATQKVSVGNASVSATTKSFTFSPGIGYHISDRFALGVDLGWSFSKVEDEPSITVIGAAPYMRYHFAELSDRVSLFSDLGAEFAFVSGVNREHDSGYYGWGIGLKPGVSVAINDHWRLIGQISLVEYSEIELKEDYPYVSSKISNTAFKFLPNEATIGVQFCF